MLSIPVFLILLSFARRAGSPHATGCANYCGTVVRDENRDTRKKTLEPQERLTTRTLLTSNTTSFGFRDERHNALTAWATVLPKNNGMYMKGKN